MMIYQHKNHNFVPKETNTSIAIDADPLHEKNKQLSNENEELRNENKELKEENHRLMNYIEKLEKQLYEIDKELLNKEHQLMDSNNLIISLENDLNHYEHLKRDLNKIEELKLQISTLRDEKETTFKENVQLNEKISGLTMENNLLNRKLVSYKEHIHMLYLILIILAVL